MSTTKLINIIFDFEVFPNWWCCCTRRVDTPEKISVITSDDPAAVRNLRLLIANCRLIGFNIRSYDLYILYAIVSGCTPSEVYEVSDNIIHNVSRSEERRVGKSVDLGVRRIIKKHAPRSSW